MRDEVQLSLANIQSEVYTREQWVSACQFHELNDAEVLQNVIHRASQAEKSIVLLDLDSTLYEVGPRTYQILMEWAHSEESLGFSEFRSALSNLHPKNVKYSVPETFYSLSCGVDEARTKQAIESANQFWMKRFFSDSYLVYDRPYLGAPEFVQKLHHVGAEIVYLTGRDSPNMGKGTEANLVRDQFPWGVERTHLLMKPSFHQDDLHFKRSAALYVRQLGNLIASFENEPPNLVALADLFPESMHVFVHTVCSEYAALPKRGLYRIRSYISE